MGREKQNPQSGKPRKKKGRYVLLAFLLLLLAAAVAALLYFYPKWRTARDFAEYLDFNGFSYEMELELFKDELEREQIEAMSAIARLAEIDADAMYRLRVSGSVYRNIIYAEIYPEGMTEPLTRLYLSNGRDMVDGGYFYRRIRSRMVGDSSLLDSLLPAAGDSLYLSVEQLEQLLDTDLSKIRKFNPSLSKYELSASEYFMILAALPYVKQAEGSELILSELTPPAGGAGDEKAVTAHLSVSLPSLIMEQNQDFLTKLGIFLDSASVKSVKSLSADLTSHQAKELVIPESEVSQEMIDALMHLRDVLSALTGNR